MPTRSLRIRKAQLGDLEAVKRLFDKHRAELGFVLRPALIKSIEGAEILVAVQASRVVGCVHYHHRRDGRTTLYHIAVEEHRRRTGVGAALIRALRDECDVRSASSIALKCPIELAANQFYKQLGFCLLRTETGKHRQLNVWLLPLGGTKSLSDGTDSSCQPCR